MQDNNLSTSERHFKDCVVQEMKFFLQKGLLDPIPDYQTIDNWIAQFPEDSLTPYFILDALILISKQHMEASLKHITEQIKASLYKKDPSLSDKCLFNAYNTHLKHSVFVCACSQGQLAGGAPEAMRALRNVIGTAFHEVATTDLCKTIAHDDISNIYVVDDFIGTGGTMKNQIEQTYACETCPCNIVHPKCSIKCAVSNHSKANFSIISVVLHSEGRTLLSNSYPMFDILSAYQINEDYNILSDTCTLYRDKAYVNKTISDIYALMKAHGISNGKYSQNLSIGINDGFPNNSLELLWWAESSSWIPLIPRQH